MAAYANGVDIEHSNYIQGIPEMMRYRGWWLGVSLALCVGNAGAVSFGTFDPRAMAMGGTGVSDAAPGTASYYNPALLATARKSDDFSLEFPVVGITLADPDNLRDSLNNFQNNDNTQKFSDAINAFQSNPSQANADTAASAGQALLSDLQALSDKAAQFDANTGLAIAVPSTRLGVAVIVNARALGGMLLDVTPSDVAAIQTALTKIQNLDPTVTDPTQNLTSAVLGTGAILEEVGVSLARNFDVTGTKVAFGITPKVVRADTFDYKLDVNTASVSLGQGRKSQTSFNLDLGTAVQLGAGLKAGMVIKNVIPKDYTTALNNVIKSKPQARAGVTYQNKWTTLAMDIDLTKNDPTGLDAPTQFIALGAEFDALGWAQLRAGYRYNMKNSNTSAASLGVGVSPFGVHIDLAAVAGNNLLGVGLQAGYRF